MNKTYMKYIIMLAAVSVLALAGGCKNSTYYQLTDEEMLWLVYKNNELLKFENTNGDIMFYYVTIRVKSYTKSGDTYREFTTANFDQLNDTTAIFQSDSQGVLFLQKSENGFLVTFTWPHFPIKEIPLTGRIPSTATVDGINYNDVFFLDATGFTDARFYNQKIWVSKSFGVLQIEENDGTLWTRKF